MTKYGIITGDISAQDTDAIVNAANISLLGGGGVDGAIHRRAGRRLLEECKRIRQTKLPSGLPVGHTVVTPGYALPCKHIIHTVGPLYETSAQPEKDLTNCYRNCIRAAESVNAKSLAFCAISAGAYGYPLHEAAIVAVRTVLTTPNNLELIRFVLFKEPIRQVFQETFDAARNIQQNLA